MRLFWPGVIIIILAVNAYALEYKAYPNAQRMRKTTKVLGFDNLSSSYRLISGQQIEDIISADLVCPGPQGIQGIQGPPGASGSPDTADQVIGKVNTSTVPIDRQPVSPQTNTTCMSIGRDISGNVTSCVSPAKIMQRAASGVIGCNRIWELQDANGNILEYITNGGTHSYGPTFPGPLAVSSTNPVNNGSITNSFPANTITITMNNSMDMSSVASLLTISPSIGYSLSGGQTITITPSGNLSPATTYTITLGAGTSDMDCNALANDYVFRVVSP